MIIIPKEVAVITLEYKGKVFTYEEKLDAEYHEGAAHYMWTESNYACDCNRANFLNLSKDEFPELFYTESDKAGDPRCGDNIKMKSFKVEKR